MGFEFDLEFISKSSMVGSGKNALHDDFKALAHYGQLGVWPGLADPTNLGDFKTWKSLGFSSGAAVGFTLGRAILLTAFIGWAIDWDHKRAGGYDELYKSQDGDYYEYHSFSGYEETVPEW